MEAKSCLDVDKSFTNLPGRQSTEMPQTKKKSVLAPFQISMIIG